MTQIRVRQDCPSCSGWGWVGKDRTARTACRRCDGTGVVELWITLSELRRRMEEPEPVPANEKEGRHG